MSEEVTILDSITGKYYRYSRDMRDNMRYQRVDKRMFEQMKYEVGIDTCQSASVDNTWKVRYMGEWITPETTSIKQQHPLCSSCKTSHKPEKLDLIGRCTVKLKSHNEKLRKIYWAHKK